MLDFCAKLGAWPYRPVHDVKKLLHAMDAHEIDHAVVSSLSAVHYLNPQDGNEELARIVARTRDRFVPFAVIRPDFTGWEDDLTKCYARYGMKGIVLHPGYHGYTLNEPCLEALMHAAAERSLPVCVQTTMEDPRRQFNRPIVPQTPPAEVGALARKYPETTVVALGLKGGQPEEMGEPLAGNLYFDISNYERMNLIEEAVERFGARRMLFGAHFPLFNVEANVRKLACADISKEARKAIGEGNARDLLKWSHSGGFLTPSAESLI
ncbi:MAG: amidohydrolase family protein [Candidatus Hydrogenedentes bacterium]|nr:amidohydrolase family protein [Candidatus Hydrogenedentota bacterium]